MNKEKDTHVCPVELAGSLDNSFRKWLQNPKKILQPFIKEEMTVLDLGCGPGFFSIEIAKLLNNTGTLIAADIQEGMLQKIRQKVRGTALEQHIQLHKCQEEHIGLSEKVDFVLAFYMVHEVSDQEKLFGELKSILKPGGKLFIIEPNFHVSKKSFREMIDRIKMIGFEITGSPRVFFSRTVVLKVTAT